MENRKFIGTTADTSGNFCLLLLEMVFQDAFALFSDCEADQRLCFCYSDSTIPLLLTGIRKVKLLALFCACTSRFVSDLIGNHIVGFPTKRLIYKNGRRISIVLIHRCSKLFKDGHKYTFILHLQSVDRLRPCSIWLFYYPLSKHIRLYKVLYNKADFD